MRDLQAAVQSIRYKPGWRIEVADWTDDGGFCGVPLRLTANVVDSENGRRGEVVHARMLPPLHLIRHRDQLARLVFELLVDVERHEAGEFFRIGDEKPFDPHAQEAAGR